MKKLTIQFLTIALAIIAFSATDTFAQNQVNFNDQGKAQTKVNLEAGSKYTYKVSGFSFGANNAGIMTVRPTVAYEQIKWTVKADGETIISEDLGAEISFQVNKGSNYTLSLWNQSGSTGRIGLNWSFDNIFRSIPEGLDKSSPKAISSSPDNFTTNQTPIDGRDTEDTDNSSVEVGDDNSMNANEKSTNSDDNSADSSKSNAERKDEARKRSKEKAKEARDEREPANTKKAKQRKERTKNKSEKKAKDKKAKKNKKNKKKYKKNKENN